MHSTETVEGPESISALVRPLGGTLNEWPVYMRHYSNIYGGSVGTNMTTEGVHGEIDLKINILNIDLRKATNPLQKSQIRLDLTALGRDKVILSNEYDIFNIPVVPRRSGTGRGQGRGHGRDPSVQRTVGRQSSKLPKKYHLSDIPKFVQEKDGFKRPFSSAERKKKMLRLHTPYRYAVSKQLQVMKPEQVKARNEQLKKLYVERQA